MAERSRRGNAGASSKGGVNSALAQLKELRKSGKKHADVYEIKAEDAVFDVLDDDEYSKLVSKRRQEAGGFVVGDNGLGYEDVGEECDWGENTYEEDAGDSPPARKGGKKGSDKAADKKRPAELQPDKRRTMQRMFAAAAQAHAPAPPKPKPADAAPKGDDLLADILGNLDGSAGSSAPASTRSARPAKRCVGACTRILGHCTTSHHRNHSMASTLPKPAPQPPSKLVRVTNTIKHDHGDDATDAMDVDQPSPQPTPEAVAPAEAAPSPAPQPAPAATPSAAVSPTSGEAMGTTPWRTPMPLTSETATPATAAPAPGWQQLYQGGDDGASPAVAEAASPAVQWSQPGASDAPCADLPFFFLDAHEEPNSPDTVYLFGKVSDGNGGFASCCCRVNGMLRSLYVIPRPGVVPAPTDPELAALEEAAGASAEGRGQYNRKLHELFASVKQEMREVLAARHIDTFTMRPVKRSYAFEERSLPRGLQYVLKVKYPATHAPLPLGLSGETFAGTLGTNTSMLESLLLKRKIMGPTWVLLQGAAQVPTPNQVSWCKLEVTLSSPKHVLSNPPSGGLPTAPPPLVVAALSLKTVLTAGAKATNQIVAASCVHQQCDLTGATPLEAWRGGQGMRHFTLVRRLEGQTWPIGFEELVRSENASPQGQRNGGSMLQVQVNERALLSCLLAQLQKLDADVLVGHNVSAFHLDVLLHRMQHCKVPQWSRIGRLRRTKFPHLGSGGGSMYGGGASPGVQAAVAGRLVCDTYLSARELLREVEYSLSTLAAKLLGQQCSEVAPGDVPGKFEDPHTLLGLLQHAMSDAWLSLGLALRLNVLPLTRQLAMLSGSLWGKALQGQRAGRIEMLLLHELHARKFMLPDKLSNRERDARKAAEGDGEDDGADGQGGRRKAAYAGGLVLEPKRGLYDKYVLLLDFNSLYPSIIQEYNIDFSTVARPDDDSVPALPETSEELATLPRVIQTLVQRRRQVKALLKDEKDPDRRSQLDIRQQALKLTANSMYGCLGFANSRFYAKPLAQLITAQGREILQSTVDLVQQSLGLEVIYGDTDSIMVATGCTDMTEVQRLGFQIKREVNKRYRYLELDMDGVFKCMLLLKKKKYAAVKLEAGPNGTLKEEIEQKGLDMVRRDWCPLSKELGTLVLREILSGNSSDEVVGAVHQHLRDVAAKLAEGAVPLPKFVITKQLTKRLEDYPDAKNQPHVQVAMRRRAAGLQAGTMPGDTVPYIVAVEIGEDNTPLPASASKGVAERAHHPEELRTNASLKPDIEYYTAQQLHPVVSRLCAPIEGTDAGRLAECLGMDPARFAGQVSRGSSALEDALVASRALLDDDDRYKGATPWPFVGVGDILAGKVGPREALQPLEAQGPDTPMLSPAALANHVALAARAAAAAFYASPLRSDDETAPCETVDVCLRRSEAGPGTAPRERTCTGVMSRVVSQGEVYNQLNHFRRLLDVDAACERLRLGQAARDEAVRKVAPVATHLATGLDVLEASLQCCAYRYVNLGTLFGALTVK